MERSLNLATGLVSMSTTLQTTRRFRSARSLWQQERTAATTKPTFSSDSPLSTDIFSLEIPASAATGSATSATGLPSAVIASNFVLRGCGKIGNFDWVSVISARYFTRYGYTWNREKLGSVPLYQLFLPGTHNSGSYRPYNGHSSDTGIHSSNIDQLAFYAVLRKWHRFSFLFPGVFMRYLICQDEDIFHSLSYGKENFLLNSTDLI